MRTFGLIVIFCEGIIFGGLFFACASCEKRVPNAVVPMTIAPLPVESTNYARFSVVRVGVFQDDLAYDRRRAVYLLQDTKTRREWIGISGVGLSELGEHGKGVPDER